MRRGPGGDQGGGDHGASAAQGLRLRAVRTWAPAGSTLITGGTGAIGAQVARWLAGRGAPGLVLISRSGPDGSGVPVLAAALADAGSAVRVLSCDSADRDALAGLVERLSASGPQLTAVFHTAAVTDDGVLDRLDAARLAAALAAKAAGARHLDELTAGLDLDAFVLFSSVAGTVGGAGQGNYAAANAYLDALAESRRARGLVATSVAWGPWAGTGWPGQARLSGRGGAAVRCPRWTRGWRSGCSGRRLTARTACSP